MLAIILPFLIALVIFIFILKIVHNVIKAFFYTALLMFILFISLGYWVYNDTLDLKDHFINSSKIFLLEDKNGIIAGISVHQDEKEYITETIAEDYSNNIVNDDYNGILGDKYKLFVLNMDIFSRIETVNLFGKEISKGDFFMIMESENPKVTLNNYFSADDPVFTMMLAGSKDDADIKSRVFSHISGRLISKDPLLLLNSYREGEIVIYPETITFKLIKYLPINAVKRIIE